MTAASSPIPIRTPSRRGRRPSPSRSRIAAIRSNSGELRIRGSLHRCHRDPVDRLEDREHDGRTDQRPVAGDRGERQQPDQIPGDDVGGGDEHGRARPSPRPGPSRSRAATATSSQASAIASPTPRTARSRSTSMPVARESVAGTLQRLILPWLPPATESASPTSAPKTTSETTPIATSAASPPAISRPRAPARGCRRGRTARRGGPRP